MLFASRGHIIWVQGYSWVLGKYSVFLVVCVFPLSVFHWLSYGLIFWFVIGCSLYVFPDRQIWVSPLSGVAQQDVYGFFKYG